ncbi:MAG: hypothetical protein N3A72_12185 [bacterium]|nr:hypothetical protein [bacterium]
MKYHYKRTYKILTAQEQVIQYFADYLSGLNVKIIEQTETSLRFKYTGSFLKATHPIAWVSDGYITISPASETPERRVLNISIQFNIKNIQRFLILFPIILCGALTLLAYSILGSSITEIIRALGTLYLLVMLSMLLGYIFVKQIMFQFFQSLCNSLSLSK